MGRSPPTWSATLRRRRVAMGSRSSSWWTTPRSCGVSRPFRHIVLTVPFTPCAQSDTPLEEADSPPCPTAPITSPTHGARGRTGDASASLRWRWPATPETALVPRRLHRRAVSNGGSLICAYGRRPAPLSWSTLDRFSPHDTLGHHAADLNLHIGERLAATRPRRSVLRPCSATNSP